MSLPIFTFLLSCRTLFSYMPTTLESLSTRRSRIWAELQTARAQVAALGAFAQQPSRRIGTPAQTGSAIDQRELMILVGAVGVLLGIAYLASK